MRTQQELPRLDLIDNPDFANEKTLALCMLPMDGFDALVVKARSRRPEIGDLCSMPLLQFEQEQHLFRQFNAFKCAANLAAEKEDEKRYYWLLAETQGVKDVLALCNMRLVVNYIKKKRLSPDAFMERFSDGCEFLLKAIDKFDFSLGYKFSTYASWALIKNFARRNELSQRAERVQYLDPETFAENYDLPIQNAEVDAAAIYHESVARIDRLFKMANLGPRDVKAILESEAVFLDKKRTLGEIGEDLRVTRERVRQIKLRGLKKLRALLENNRSLLEAV